MDIVNKLKQLNIQCNKGVDFDIIEQYQRGLARRNIPVIPLSYVRFLEKANGITKDGLFLFGIKIESRDFVEDILQKNSVAGIAKNSDLIFLGDNSVEYLCYDWGQKSYLIINKIDKSKVAIFSIFEKAIVEFLKTYMKEECCDK